MINDRRIDPSSALKYYCRIILSASEAVRLGRRDDELKSPFPPKSESEEFLAYVCIIFIKYVFFPIFVGILTSRREEIKIPTA